jgi:hypothetical protein
MHVLAKDHGQLRGQCNPLALLWNLYRSNITLAIGDKETSAITSHFSVKTIQCCHKMPWVRYTIEQRVCWMRLYLNYVDNFSASFQENKLQINKATSHFYSSESLKDKV